MSYIGITPQKNIEPFISTKPLDSYPEDVIRDIKLLSFEKDKEATPFGSFIYRLQKYPADVDLVEEFKDCCSAKDVVKKFSRKLRKIIKIIDKEKIHFLSEFKAGQDYRYDIDVGRLENGVYHPNPELAKINQNLYKKKLLTEDEFDVMQKIFFKLVDKKLNGDDYDIIYNIFREHRILRWNQKEILQGYMNLPGGKIKYLEEALGEPGHVKIDMISLINGKFVEVTNFFMLAYEISGVVHPINIDLETAHHIPTSLPVEINKLYFSNFYYSPFKMCKRIYSLSRHVKDLVTLDKIIPIVSSNISLLYQIRSEIDTLALLLEKYKNPAPKSIYKELDGMKVRLATVIELSDEELNYFNDLIDAAKKANSKDAKIALLKELKKDLTEIINFETIKYLDSVGLNPPPSYLLPQEITYDRNIIRTEYEIPENPLKKVLGGSFSTWAFQKAANIYRRNFCNGKARPLLDGEIHWGCMNYEGPGTRIDLPEVANYPPYNDIDNCAREHDLAYEKYKNNPDMIRKADEDVLKCFDKYPNEDGYLPGKLGINGKMAVENVLPMVIRSVMPGFSGKGCDECGGGYRTSNGICDGSTECGGLLLPSKFMLGKIADALEDLKNI